MKRIVFMVTLFIIGSAVIFGLDRFYCESQYKEDLAELNQFAERVQYVLTRSIPDKLNVVEDLNSFLLTTENPPSTEAFDQYAAWVLARNPTLYWLGYADQGQVIRRIYPLAGNEMAINLDLKERPEDLPWSQRAILTQRTILTPPVKALQGFDAVVAYSPIIRDDQLQGLAVSLFRLDKVIDYALLDLTRSDPNYFVVVTDTTGQILWRSGAENTDGAVRRLMFPVGEAEWVAYVGWRHPPQPDLITRRLLWGSGGTIMILLMVIFNGMLSRNTGLNTMVRSKTAELAARNIRLTEEVEERKKAEEALRVSERRLEKFLSAIPDIIYQISKWGVVLDFRVLNKADLLTPPDTFMHRSLVEFFPPEVAACYMQCITAAIQTDEMQVAEYELITSEVHRWYDARFVANGPEDVLVVIRDVTERKQALADMLEAKEARVRSEKLASLGTMAAGLSHEINQPLNSIKVITTGMLYGYQMGRTREASELIRAMEEISQQADRINNIIGHMRAFIRGDDRHVAPCHWKTAIDQSLNVLGKQLSAHGIKVNKLLADDLPMMLASPTALEEIVVNLLVNAMQALDSTQSQPKEIWIRTFAAEDVVLEISDNGPGIAHENKEKIFTPFFSTKISADNLGIGLSIVQSIVGAYQGKIQMVSEKQGGAAFRVTLPAYCPNQSRGDEKQ